MRGYAIRCGGSLAAMAVWAIIAPAQLVGFDAGPGFFAEIDLIDPETGIPSAPPEYSGCYTDPTNVWFGGSEEDTGFTVGFAYVGDVLYGLEFEGGGYYLFTTGVDGFGCAHATRVGGELGVPGYAFNSLVYCAQTGVLYTHGFLIGGHFGRLYSIDPATGAATPIGSNMGEDFRILGMTCDPFSGVLYGITSGHSSRFPNVELVTIDRNDSSVTSVGVTGIPAAGMETNAESLSLIVTGTGETAVRHLYAGGAQLWELDIATGAATSIGSPDSFKGQLFGLAHRSTGGQSAGPTATPTNTGSPTASPTPAESPTSTPTQLTDSTSTPTPTPVPLTPSELLSLLADYQNGALDTAETLWRRSVDWYRKD